MQNKSFSIGEAVGFGWEKTKSNLGLFIPALIIYGIVSYFPSIFIDDISVYLVLSLVCTILGLALYLGILKIALSLYDGKDTGLGDMFSTFPLLIKFIFATIIVYIIVIIGYILLIIPGIYLTIRLMFYPFFILEGNRAIESIEKSWGLTKGKVLDLFIFGLVLIGIVILGFIALMVGSFIAIPISILGLTFVYRKLLEQTQGQITIETEATPAE